MSMLNRNSLGSSYDRSHITGNTSLKIQIKKMFRYKIITFIFYYHIIYIFLYLNITGASSSTRGSSAGGYPQETLNPPPSPATVASSTRCSSSNASRYKPYRHYRSINQPPPPTPCSTDVCDESDSNYPARYRYESEPFPPPPTPRSVYHSDAAMSCPPSPSSRSSTYFSPLPPPPSPVP
jgi:low density lipoprotein receptor-related protein 5/6